MAKPRVGCLPVASLQSCSVNLIRTRPGRNRDEAAQRRPEGGSQGQSSPDPPASALLQVRGGCARGCPWPLGHHPHVHLFALRWFFSGISESSKCRRCSHRRQAGHVLSFQQHSSVQACGGSSGCGWGMRTLWGGECRKHSLWLPALFVQARCTVCVFASALITAHSKRGTDAPHQLCFPRLMLACLGHSQPPRSRTHGPGLVVGGPRQVPSSAED